MVVPDKILKPEAFALSTHGRHTDGVYPGYSSETIIIKKKVELDFSDFR